MNISGVEGGQLKLVNLINLKEANEIGFFFFIGYFLF